MPLKDPLDIEHTTSCGHKWTMRHTACPQCFEEMRDENKRLSVALRQIHALTRSASDVFILRIGSIAAQALYPDWRDGGQPPTQPKVKSRS